MNLKDVKFILVAWKPGDKKHAPATLYFTDAEAADMNQEINYYRGKGCEVKIFEARN